MTTADDGLVSVVCVQVKATATEYLAEDVTWCGNTLPGRSTDTDGERLPHRFPLLAET
jgi:hypothetical protein